MMNHWFHYRTKKSNSNSDKWENGTVLTIKKVNAKAHQGNYTCAPSTLTSSSVIVHIIDEGKMPQDAAVYDSFDSSSSSTSLISYFMLVQQNLFPSIIILFLNYNLLSWLINNFLWRLWGAPTINRC